MAKEAAALGAFEISIPMHEELCGMKVGLRSVPLAKPSQWIVFSEVVGMKSCSQPPCSTAHLVTLATILPPTPQVNHIVGKAGRHIKAIEEATGAVVSLPGGKQAPSRGKKPRRGRKPHNHVVVRASTEEVAQAAMAQFKELCRRVVEQRKAAEEANFQRGRAAWVKRNQMARDHCVPEVCPPISDCDTAEARMGE